MRKKIWELVDLQCPVIGTCLNVKELKKIARQTKYSLGEDWTEFQIHGAFVTICRENNPVAKVVNKTLERKYSTAVRAFTKAKNEDELRQLWKQAYEEGDIPGPFWAVLTHPATTAELRTDVFGQVHMLSHLVGSANRADIRRLAELEKLSEREAARHARAKSLYRERLKDLKESSVEKDRKIFSMSKELETLRNNAKQGGSDILREENDSLKCSLGSMSLMLFEANSKAEDMERRVDAALRRMQELEAAYAEKAAEVDFLEKELLRVSNITESRKRVFECDKAGTDGCPGPDLCGKRILYVGGRTNMVRHYRDLVERFGGEFLHHDGGVEQASQMLARLLPGVDAVICPLDCVSHGACTRVKEICKSGYKPLKLLNSSGLSSLAGSLEELAKQYSIERVS